MQDLLRSLNPEDHAFLLELVSSPFNEAGRLKYAEYTPDIACAALERELRYLGSSDLAYLWRRGMGREPGAAFRSIIRDTARFLKIPLANAGSERAMVRRLAEEYAVREFGALSPERQVELLGELGVGQAQALGFLKRSAGVFAAPLLIEAFGRVVVQGLIKSVLFGMVTRIVGRQLATRLFTFMFARVPWWAGWIGPAAWTVSIGWAALDLQGPARRKTVPALLYLGMCVVRDGE